MSSQSKDMSFVELQVFPFDVYYMLRPGTISYVLEVEGCPPEETLMIIVPLSVFAENREPLREFVANKLKRTLVAIIADDETPLATVRALRGENPENNSASPRKGTGAVTPNSRS